MRGKTKYEKGITLIALVVTIIVLLILSGIAISLNIGNNGIFKRVGDATYIHSASSSKEKEEILLLDNIKPQNYGDDVTGYNSGGINN